MLRDRTDLERAIQQARIAESGRRTSRLFRKKQVISHYGDAWAHRGSGSHCRSWRCFRYRREDNTPTPQPASS